jgi:hypothetical protein
VRHQTNLVTVLTLGSCRFAILPLVSLRSWTLLILLARKERHRCLTHFW